MMNKYMITIIADEDIIAELASYPDDRCSWITEPVEVKPYKKIDCATNWIKIKCPDDLPDLDVDVLGTTKEYGDVVKVTRWKTLLEKCGWEWVLTDDIEGTSYKPDEIIAWMPLPEGFKEENDGN